MKDEIKKYITRLHKFVKETDEKLEKAVPMSSAFIRWLALKESTQATIKELERILEVAE